jgi:hypothetical protein
LSAFILLISESVLFLTFILKPLNSMLNLLS